MNHSFYFVVSSFIFSCTLFAEPHITKLDKELRLPFMHMKISKEWNHFVTDLGWGYFQRENDKNETLFLLTARIASDRDTLPVYREILSKPVVAEDGTSYVSSSYLMTQSGVEWVKAIHEGLPRSGMVALLLGTVIGKKNKVALSIQLAIDKKKYEENPTFFDELTSSITLHNAFQELSEKVSPIYFFSADMPFNTRRSHGILGYQ